MKIRLSLVNKATVASRSNRSMAATKGAWIVGCHAENDLHMVENR